MTATTRLGQCGLNGCTNLTDPDSRIGRCMDCTAAVEVEIMRVFKIQQDRRAAVTRRAAVDAALLAKSLHRGDDAAGQVIVDHCDIHSVVIQLTGYLLATLRHFGVDVEERLDMWLTAARNEIGEPS